jgi:hypothetical protein
MLWSFSVPPYPELPDSGTSGTFPISKKPLDVVRLPIARKSEVILVIDPCFMGSYLSIYNDTDRTVSVSIGPDEAAAKIAGIVAMSVAGVATAGGVVATMAVPCAAVAATLGVGNASMVAAAITAAGICEAAAIPLGAASAISAGTKAALFITEKCEKEKGMVTLKPGDL